MAEKNDQAKQVQIKTSDEMSRGRYSNNMLVTHSPEEFVIDWLLNSPGGTHLVSRIVVSPGHMKRIVAALEGNGGITTAEFCPLRYHLMLVRYDIHMYSSLGLLASVRSHKVNARLMARYNW